MAWLIHPGASIAAAIDRPRPAVVRLGSDWEGRSREASRHDPPPRPGHVSRVVNQHDASAENRAYYERDDVRRNFRPDRGLDAAEAALVAQFLPAAATVLDLGCGNGRVAIALAGLGHRVEGIDISPSMIDEARAATAALGIDARFRIGDAVALPHDENELDAVVFGDNGIGHLTRAGKVACLLEIGRVLRPGGVALLSLRTPYALNRMLPRMLGNVILPRKGLRPDEERDDDQYVQRPPLSWLVRECREARLEPVCVCSRRQAAAGRFPQRAKPIGGQFYVVAKA
jgi:SAM-dependent methyltransferase